MKLCPHCETGYHDQLTNCPTHGGMLSEIRELKPGMVIHRTYRIIRKLGQGGMGTVYLAEHLLMEEQRALKFLATELSQDAAFTGRFRREVRTLRQVRHKNVVDCGDLEQAEDDSLFFAMEFVNGPDLRTFLNKAPQPFDVEMALAITEGIAEGLAAAHAMGMVHRDIKPENILMVRIGDTFVPKIADFGIVATKETSNYTQTGSSLLTPFYAAPEQWRGARAAELDGRTDLYALGGLLFQMLTGEKVFDAENYEGWSYQHQRIQPRSPSSVRPELADWRGLDALVLSLLAKETAGRPNDVSGFLNLLAEVEYVSPVTMRRTSQRTASSVSVPASVSDASVNAAGKVSRRIPAWGWAVGAVMLLAAAFAAGRFFRSQPAKLAPDASPQAVSTASTQPISQSAAFQPAAGTPAVPQQTGTQVTPKPAKNMKPGRETAIAQQPQIPEVTSAACAWTSDLGAPDLRHDPIKIKNYAQAYYDKGCYPQSSLGFRQACDLGNEYSCNQLGFMYRQGKGVVQDYSRALALFSQACNGGSTGGCDNLGILYDKGWGVEQDSSHAAVFFSKGCDGGGGNACTNLGILYLEGRGLAKNPVKGKELLTRGCSLGDSRGCGRLAKMH